MSNKTNAPKIFISYSWKPVQNQNWVIQLAERLVSDGVNVVLDVWDLEEGHDKYAFMEKMVLDPDISKVLIVSNKIYAEKANSREGGVGSESMIISSEIYDQATQIKFLPLVMEYKDVNKPFLPIYVKSRIYFDFSQEERYEEEYEKLLRNIFGKPSKKKPPIGNPPSFITDDDPVYLRTSQKVSRIKNALLAGNENSKALIIDYLDLFLKSLDDFKIDLSQKAEFDDLILASIDKLILLRNDFNDFFNNYVKYSVKIDNELIHEFIEKLIKYLWENDFDRQYSGRNYLSLDNYRFFLWELFLYLATILIKNNKFETLSHLLQQPYYVHFYEKGETEYLDYTILRYYVETIDSIRNKRLSLNRISVSSDLLLQRANWSGISFEDLKQSDLALYYISLFFISGTRLNNGYWFPMLSVYRGSDLLLFNKMKSKSYFEKIKSLFMVNDKEEFLSKLSKIGENQKSHRFGYGFGNNIQILSEIDDFAKIATLP